MDLPQAPADTELRNIIDKLAQFVARNGPDFEQMTKNKQKGNPKFQFLYGGEYYNYYQCKVQAEQVAIVKPADTDHTPIWQDPPHISDQQQQTIISAAAGSTTIATIANPVINIQLAPPPQLPQLSENPEIALLTAQIDALQEQVNQSEQNLQAQQTVLLQQQQVQSEQVLIDATNSNTIALAAAASLNLLELDTLLLPIVESCTKDSVQAGKHWILQHATNTQSGTAAAQAIANVLLEKVMRQLPSPPPFTHRLHVIYLVNDVLHHCARKNAAEVKDAFESVVVPMFCSATLSATTEEQRTKLNKLLELWKSKANYLSSVTVDAMRKPQESLQQHKAAQMSKYTAEISAIVQQTQVTFEGYNSQHQAYVAHATNQITELENGKLILVEEQQKHHQALMVAHAAAVAVHQQQQQQQQIQQLQQQPQATVSSVTVDAQQPPPPPPPQQQSTPATDITLLSSMPPQLNMPPNIPPPTHFHNPPPNFFPMPGLFPDFSRPPPGFPPVEGGVAGMPPQPILGATPMAAAPPSGSQQLLAEQQQQHPELFPSVPYYELPAGLMVPLIKLADMKFISLDPGAIRLPPPAPPSERLLAAVEAFYAPPSHERPRDSEGWEKLGLYEYYKGKHGARKERDEQVTAGLRECSRSPSPITIPMDEQRTPSPPRRRYTSPTPGANRERDYAAGRDHGANIRRRSRSRSISRSPPPVLGAATSAGGSGRRRDRDRGDREHRRSNRRKRTRSRSRSKSPSSINMFAVPPIPVGIGGIMSPESIDSTNKGHQMLKRMGWGGSGGLGAQEQGIDSPISGGDVRDKQDQFKGVGCNLNDPYENFRKNKGAAFITRMKARAEERTDVVKTPTRASE